MSPFASFGPSPFSEPGSYGLCVSPHRFRGVADARRKTCRVRPLPLSARLPDLRFTGLGRKSFAGTCLLARPPIRFLSVSRGFVSSASPAPISRWNPCASRGSLRPVGAMILVASANRYSKVPLVSFETRDVMRRPV